eukprot:TRINITY_DN7300_c0_g1_i3.p1 TRINITY_DN7300_c0_g1~~TRINITY_DN7300_c0_g1_i3.p1  ORF type:complete len:147 (-),score=20.99 TRINITY_DN7300_c0_g1_i3:75-515(-)
MFACCWSQVLPRRTDKLGSWMWMCLLNPRLLLEILTPSRTVLPKKAARICAYLPDINSTNPIAAITNFCRRQLRLEVTFEAELSSEDSSDPAYCARVVLTDDAGFSAEYTYSKMEFATDQAADAGLKLLERAFIEAGIAATRGGKF